MRHTSLLIVLVCVLGSAAGLCNAQPAPVQQELSLTDLPLLPFGGEYLIAATWSGVITNTEVQLTFTTAGEFQAENLAMSFSGPTGGFAVFGGTDLSWSGQGTFTASFESGGLNGEITTPQGSSELSYWFMNIAPVLDSFPTPLEGELGESFIRLTIQPCIADWNGDFASNVPDVFAYLTDWFRGETNADIDGVPGVGVSDIFRFLTFWFAGCGAF
jgi:hypothetical protein